MSAKNFAALFNGITRQIIFEDAEITDEFLKEQLYPEITQEEFEVLLSKCKTWLQNISYFNMDFKQLEAFLKSQMTRNKENLTEDQVTAILKYWKSNKDKVQATLLSRTKWEDRFRMLKWQIDLGYKKNKEIDNSKAVFQLGLTKCNGTEEELEFEVNSESLNNMISQVEKVHAKIDSLSK
ncbi:COMM domain-containing protein 1 [Hydra vulgaris]|uniref:COMM domain-containing protein 1 n=1 Tax=Hydra vulgaris TaxID=6087 RepID=A0ABM4DG37_HYDVU